MPFPPKTLAALAAAAGILTATAAAAHHSGAMFDPANPVVLEGTIKAVNWVNPHVMIEIMADGKDGQPSGLWVVESSSPGRLVRAGMTKRSFNPGDHASIEVAPLRRGGAMGSFMRGTTQDGKVVSFTARPREEGAAAR